MAKNLNVALLLDIYGNMLTERQRDIVDLYYNEDLSLGEIATEENITRQGVLNCVKKSEAHLFEFEEKLGLGKKFEELLADVEKLEELILFSEMKNEKVMAEIDEKILQIKNRL